MALPSGYDGLKGLTQFFSGIKLAGRTNQTGAFTETNVFDVPFFYVMVTGFDNGSGSSAGVNRAALASGLSALG